MKINYLKILSPFRGLPTNYRIDFDQIVTTTDRIEPICFIGLNGSGKSNVLEVLSECFYFLEAYTEETDKRLVERYNSSFGFELEFSMNPLFSETRIEWDKFPKNTWDGRSILKIKYIKHPQSFPCMIINDNLNNPILTSELFLLPNRIIGYSSGMNELISNPFLKMNCFYFEKLKKESTNEYFNRSEMNRMFLMDYEGNKIITICNQIYGRSNQTHILNNEIELKDIYSFNLYFKLIGRYYKELNLSSGSKLILDKLVNCATSFDEHKVGKGSQIKLGFKIDNGSRDAFTKAWPNAFELFTDLYKLSLLNLHQVPDYLIKRAKDLHTGKNLNYWMTKTSPQNLFFYVDDIFFLDMNNNKISYKHLSDGEHQLVHVLSGLMLLETKNSLFILDEPDTHFNPDWRSKFVYLLNKVMIAGNKEQTVLITTHSPYVVSDCKRENVFIFHKDKTTTKPTLNTFGTSVNLITQQVFDKKQSISKVSEDEINRLSKLEVHNLSDIYLIKEESRNLGESAEKIMLFHQLINQEEALNPNA